MPRRRPGNARALVDGCGLELINRGQLNLIYKWRQHVPDEIAERFPVLVLAMSGPVPPSWGWWKPTACSMSCLSVGRKPSRGAPLSDKLLATLAIKSVIALQKDDLQTCIALARRVEVQLGQHTAFLEVAMLIVGALANVMIGQAGPGQTFAGSGAAAQSLPRRALSGYAVGQRRGAAESGAGADPSGRAAVRPSCARG